MTEQKDDAPAARKLVSKKQLSGLVRDAMKKKDEISSIAGLLGERVKQACENGHMHRGLFGLMTRLARMEETKRAEFIELFPVYVDFLREEGIFGSEHVGDLAKMAKDQEDAEAAARKAIEARVADNVTKLNRGIKAIPDGADAPGTYSVSA